MKPALVIFDCDGVLVDTETITTTIIASSMTRHGLPMAPHEAHALFVGGTMQSAGIEGRRRGAALPDDWLDVIYPEIFAALQAGVDVFEGVHELLDLLNEKGIASAVASNGPIAKMQITLTPSGLWDRLAPHIYSGQIHAAPKPEPDLLLLAARNAGIDPADCVMIDDTTVGTRAAQAAGMRAIGFAAASDANAFDKSGFPVARGMTQVTRLLGLG
jgi:HAD superfamily hydrolase (TIGR01509 family)